VASLEWLRSLSFNTIAILVIVAGLAAIILANPPRTACDAEVEAFQMGVVGFLYIHPKATVKTVRYHEMAERCKRGNGPGGCLELFSGLKKTLLALNSVSPGCLPETGKLKEVRGSIFRSIDLMSKLAWGSQPPSHPNLKVGFFDPGDLNLFCRLKAKAIQIYGEDEWITFQKGSLRELPGISALSQQDAWDKSIYSLACAQYL
jgi:hypothetical protein